MERTLNLRINKQEKFKQNIADWEKDNVFDPTLQMERSQTRRSRSRRNPRASKNTQSTDSEEDSPAKSVSFLDRDKGGIDTSDTPKGQNPSTQQVRRKLPTQKIRNKKRTQGS